MNKKIELIDLHVMPYQEAWAKQTFLMEKLKTEKRMGVPSVNYLLLVEHPHVYTLGRNGNRHNLLIDAIQLRANDAEFIQVDRGGDITYHGYGQLVVYPIIRLDMFKTGIKDYVWKLEEVVIRTISDYGLTGERLKGSTGVWLDAGLHTARKICAIGVRCSESVTMHGFALNVNTDLKYFSYINPCGIIDKGVTSIEKELNRTLAIDSVKEKIAKHFKDIWETEVV